MPYQKLMETPVSDYTSLMKKQLLDEHRIMHAWWATLLSGKELRDKKGHLITKSEVQLRHSNIVRKMLALGFGHNEVDSLDATLSKCKSQPLENVLSLSDKGLLAAHHYAHVVFKLTEGGATDWGVFSSSQDLVNYHKEIVEEMEKRGFSHIFQDPGLDNPEACKVSSSTEENFLKLAKWDVTHPKTLTWLKASAAITKFLSLKGRSLLELGCSGGGLLETLAFSGYEVKGVDFDADAVAIGSLKGLNIIKEDALAYLQSQPDNSCDVVCSSHCLEHLYEPVKVLLEAERVAKVQSIHVAPLGTGICEDHVTEWAKLSDLISWLLENDLHYYVERDDDCVVIVKNLHIPENLRKFDIMSPLMVTADYVSIVGSTIKGSDPGDLDVLIRDSKRDKGIELQLTKQIRASGYMGKLEFVYNPAGPHGDYLPVFDKILQRTDNLEVKLVSSPVYSKLEVSKSSLEESHRCEYCDDPAVVAYVWADGRAMIPVCQAHRDKAKHQIEVTNKDKVTFVTPLPQGIESSSKLRDESQLGKWFPPLKPAKSFETLEECWNEWAKPIIEGGESIHVEMKLDGYRARLVGRDKPVVLGPRPTEDYTSALPSVAAELKKVRDSLLDSEILLYDKKGVVSREDLAVLFSKDPKTALEGRFVVAWVFIALMLDGDQIDTLSYSDRRELLSKWFKGKGFKYLKLLPSFPANTRDEFFKYASKVSDVEGSEGAIFKRASKPYTWGEVTSDWAKVKSVTEVFCEVLSRDQVKPVPGQPVKWVYQLAVRDQKGNKIGCGNSMATVESALPGQIVEVRINRVWKSNGEYSFLFPIIIEVRVDKSKPSSTRDLDLLEKRLAPVKDEGAVKKVLRLFKNVVRKVLKSEENYYGFTREDVKSMTDRAIEELQMAGLFDKDSDYGGMIGRAVEQLLKVFQQQGHSGFSANMASLLFYKLCKGEVLSPLTVKKEEWEEVGTDVLQNKRCFSVFSTPKDLQKGRAHTIDGIVWIDKDGFSYTNKNSIVWFDLPGFPPETKYLESIEDDAVKFYITIESVKQLMKVDRSALTDEGGEAGEGAIKNTVGLIKTGDVGKWVLHLHDVRTLHADLRVEIPSKPGWLVKYTLFIPNRVIDGERYGVSALREAGPKVLKYLLEKGHLAGNITPQLVPKPWLYVGRTEVATFDVGVPGGSPNKEGHMLAIDYGTFEAVESFEDHHSALYLLNGKLLRNKLLSVVGVKPAELRLEDPELAGVAKRVWLFSLVEPKEEAKIGWTSEARAGALARRGTGAAASPVSRKEMEEKYGTGKLSEYGAVTLKQQLLNDFKLKDEKAAEIGRTVISDWSAACLSEGGALMQGLAAKTWGEGRGISPRVKSDIRDVMSKTSLDKSAADRFMSWEKESTGYLLDRVYPAQNSMFLFRGVSKRFEGDVSVKLNSLSSWTTDTSVATLFGDLKGGCVLKAFVPKRKVFSCFQGAEREFIILGNEDLRAGVLK